MCQLWDLSASEELSQKRTVIAQLADLAPLHSVDFSPLQFRHRMDFVIRDGQLGLPARTDTVPDATSEKGADTAANPNSRAVFAATACLITSARLQATYLKLADWTWPLTKGSLRLRESPEGQVGAWLDLANEDLFKLLEDEFFLLRLLEIFPNGNLEVGQRRKILKFNANQKSKTHRFELAVERPGLWWQTWVPDGEDWRAVPLRLPIGAFSQPSLSSQREMIRICTEIWQRTSLTTYLEWGAGCGNFAVAAAHHFTTGLIVETDPIVTPALEENLRPQSHFRRSSSLQNGTGEKLFALVNPPRSGLGAALSHYLSGDVAEMIYIACNPVQFLQEWPSLQTRFELRSSWLVNQFPRTHHFEVMVHLMSRG